MHKSSWWTNDHDSAWDRVKDAFKRDWEQTKHDFGGNAPDLDQDVDDTLKQAAGKSGPGFDNYENDFRYGYGARQQYKDRSWDSDLESELSRDYNGDWNSNKQYVRRGFEFNR